MAEKHPTLLSPVEVGPYTLRNRIVMAPMTRNRAGEGNAPTPAVETYYRQRASAGLIVTEGTQVSLQGVGYLGTPGIHTDEQVEAWRRVTAAVHAEGGRIFLQLWHVGRISDPALQPGGVLPVAPSAVAAEGLFRTPTGTQPFVVPRALDLAEIPGVIAQFADGAERSLAAGFDGVEIHGANGYLLDQFLRDGSNHRTDAYGGTLEKRARFLLEVTEEVARVWGPERVGVRLSPQSAFNGMADSDPSATFGHAAAALDRFGLAYLHLVAPEPEMARPPARALLWAADPQRRLHPGERRRRRRLGSRRPRLLRHPLPRQPRPPRALRRGSAAQLARPQNLLRRRRGGLYRLPDPAAGGGFFARLTQKSGLPPGGRVPPPRRADRR